MRSQILMILWLVCVFLVPGRVALAETVEQAPPAANPEAAPDAASDDPLGRLVEIRRQLLEKRKELDELRKVAKSEKREEQAADIERRLEELPKSIEALSHSFEQIAIGGVDLTVLAPQQEAEFDWKEELVQITKPLLATLKELTEKPRRIEHLRSEIQRYQQQLRVVGKALDSIQELQHRGPPPIVAERLRNIAESWEQRQADTRHALQVATYQLATLQGEPTSSLESIVQSLGDFFRGRGLTLLIAVTSLLLVWLLVRAVFAGLGRVVEKRRLANKRVFREQALRYLRRAASLAATIVTLVVVFYVRSDLLLLALTLIALVMLGVSLKQTLPRYVKEIRLLLDFGGVREGERMLVNGTPLRVDAIGASVFLRNPELEGVVRLPLGAVTDLVSRPVAGEPWFPCRVGELLMLADGRVVEVMSQTVERVRVRFARSPVEYATSDFLGLEFRNLSREGFGIPITFGIDYRHQAICLDEVPAKMAAAVREALAEAGPIEHLADLVVEFKEAGANSLDYLVYLSMQGPAAADYFALTRRVQRALVALCNREGWVIPFSQLTIHQGEGFEALCAADKA